MPNPGGSQGDEHPLLRQISVMERRLQEITRAMEHRERLATLGTVAGLLAHEFNNILTPIMSYAQMALASPEDADLTSKALKRAAEGSERASQIAGVILGFIKQEGPAGSGAAEVPRETNHAASVARCIEQALCCMVREPAKDGIKLRVVAPEGVSAAIRPVSLQHVLLNLLLNARAAMVPGGGVLDINAQVVDALPRIPDGAATSDECSTWNISGSVRHIASPTKWVQITVKDTGRGMSPQTLTRVFGRTAAPSSLAGGPAPAPPAARTSATTSCHAPYVYQPAGTGLGLTLCKQLLDEVGGRLVIRSAEGQGTTCFAFVPLESATSNLRKSA